MNPTPVLIPGAVTIGVAGIRFPPGLTHLLGFARQWCHVVALTSDVHQPIDAVVVRHAALLDDPAVPVPPGRVAVWIDGPDEMSQAGGRAADVVLSGSDEVLEKVGRRGLLVPTGPTAPGGRLMAPHVRARLRTVRHLPRDLVVEYGEQGWQSTVPGPQLGPELGLTAMTCASAAIATEAPRVVEALAWGTPCVTDPGSARIVGARADLEVLVGESPDDRGRMAAHLGADPARAAQLSWQGRQLVESRHCPEHAAASLMRRFGWIPVSMGAVPGPLAACLGEFDTPADAVVVARAAAATRLLAGLG